MMYFRAGVSVRRVEDITDAKMIPFQIGMNIDKALELNPELKSKYSVFRSRLMAVYEKMMDGISQSRKRNMEGQLSLFEMGAGGDDGKETAVSEEAWPEIREFPQKMLLSMEKEMLGLYVSGHPLMEYEKEIAHRVTLLSSDLGEAPEEGGESREQETVKNVNDGMIVTVGGIITGKKTKTTKSNNLMAFVTLEDLYGTMEIIVFPTILTKYAGLLADENIVLIRGRISIREEEPPKIICEEVSPLKRDDEMTRPVSNQPARLYIRTEEPEDSPTVASAMALFKFFKGSTPVCFYNEKNREMPKRTVGNEYWVKINDSLLQELKNRFGEENVKVAGNGNTSNTY